MNLRAWLVVALVCGCDNPRLIAVGIEPDALAGTGGPDASPDASAVIAIDANMSSDPDAAIVVGGFAIEPAAITVPAGRNQIFVANAVGPAWSVVEASGGTIDGSGVYTAPDAPGVYHVTASDGTSTGTATVVVKQMNLSVLTGGLGGFGNVDGVGDRARFVQMAGVVASGTKFYVADYDRIRVIDRATSQVTTLAGGGTGSSYDGIGTSARFLRVWSMALDASSGTLYVSDGTQIRTVDLGSRAVTTIAGAFQTNGLVDGPGVSARFKAIRGLCLVGSTLYVGDGGNNMIRALDTSTPSYTVGPVAGAGVAGYADASVPTAARFSSPMDLACTQSTIYVADRGNSAIRTIDRATGAVGTLAGGPGRTYSDGAFSTAGITNPAFLALDAAHGVLYSDDYSHGVIRALDLGSQSASTLAGDPTQGGWVDGVGTAANLSQVAGMVSDGQTLWFADRGNTTFRKVDVPTATVATVAGVYFGATAGSANGPLDQATFAGPTNLSSDGAGNIFVASDYAVRTISPATGMVSLRAGLPGAPGMVDGDLSTARFGMSYGLLVDPTGMVWAADSTETIRRVGNDGTVTSSFGALGQRGTADGNGNGARFYGPAGMVVVGTKMIVADLENYTLRSIDRTTGQVTTLAGAPGVQAGDDGIGALARFRGPYALATDGVRTVWVGDWGGNGGGTIREVDLATGKVTTIAGDFAVHSIDDGVGTAAHFTGPYALAYDGHGSLYIADTGLDLQSRGVATIRRMWVPSRAVSTYAGRKGFWGASPGPLQTATLAYPLGLALTPSGDLLVTGENAVFSITSE